MWFCCRHWFAFGVITCLNRFAVTPSVDAVKAEDWWWWQWALWMKKAADESWVCKSKCWLAYTPVDMQGLVFTQWDEQLWWTSCQKRDMKISPKRPFIVFLKSNHWLLVRYLFTKWIQASPRDVQKSWLITKPTERRTLYLPFSSGFAQKHVRALHH